MTREDTTDEQSEGEVSDERSEGEVSDERSAPGDAGDETDTASDEQGPTPQSAALRRQQRYVGLGGAALAGLALAVGTVQRFPDAPAGAALAGIAGTVLVLWVVRRSIFPGSAAGENTEDGA